MKKHRWFNTRALLALIVCSGLLAVGAQQSQNAQTQPSKSQQKQGEKKPAGDKQESPDTQQITTTNVRLPITVTDKNRRFITTLQEKDFEVFEDKTPQAIVSFQPQSNQALDVGVLM